MNTQKTHVVTAHGIGIKATVRDLDIETATKVAGEYYWQSKYHTVKIDGEKVFSREN